jgi:hypothetical protein
MHKLKLLCLTALALFSFAAFAASAFAEEPAILVAEGKVSELKATLTGTAPIQLISLSGEKTITATGAIATVKGCKELSEKDTNLCEDQSLTFTGLKQGEVACRSENAKAEKDPIETILTLLDEHVVSQKNAAKELVPALQAKILGNALEAEVKFNCGTTKSQVKGTIECLLSPGLKTTTAIEKVCKVNATTHDAEKGTCEILCTDLGTVGLEANLDGKTFKDAWELITLKGTTNKSIFIDG